MLTLPGKVDFLIFSPCSGFDRIRPPCGPGRVLWVLAVIASAPSCKGSWNSAPAMSPATWAASKQILVSDSWNESASCLTGCGKGRTEPPSIARVGFLSSSDSFWIFFSVASMSMFISSVSNGRYSTLRPLTAPAVPPNSFFPMLMWPPAGIASARIVSPGVVNVV